MKKKRSRRLKIVWLLPIGLLWCLVTNLSTTWTFQEARKESTVASLDRFKRDYKKDMFRDNKLFRGHRDGNRPRQLVRGSARKKEDPRQPLLIHLHVMKCGGTSLDRIGQTLALDSGHRYVGLHHFDWSYIDGGVGDLDDKFPEAHHKDVVLILRQPVSRAVSHYHFVKKKRFVRKYNLAETSLDDYLHNYELMMKTRAIWQDGQASIMWLTGTHLANGVGIPSDQVDERERIASNYTAMCHLAADRLEQTLWFGIMEDMDRSMELLQHALKLNYKPELPRHNVERGKTIMPTEWENRTLESLMPQDLWLYEYGKRLFEARWTAYKTGVFTRPERPPLPEMTCTSTRFELTCTSGPLAKSGPFHFKIDNWLK